MDLETEEKNMEFTDVIKERYSCEKFDGRSVSGAAGINS